MLKLKRRETTEFLDADHERALKARMKSAQDLAAEGIKPADKTRRIRGQWDNFRAGKTSRGTFALLWSELCAMSHEKCTFCEVPAPSTVEHKDELSKRPERAFDWENLLAACGDCNRYRENSGVESTPLDPTDIEPLDLLGWDEYGKFTPNPGEEVRVEDLVHMYSLSRFDDERRSALADLKTFLVDLVESSEPPRRDVVERIQAALTATRAFRGPVREYLLRPPTENDAWLVDEALRRLPDIRTWVAPWLRPPAWAKPRWSDGSGDMPALLQKIRKSSGRSVSPLKVR